METAFDVVRAHVDMAIAELVPDAPGKLSAAFENAASDNPEHWANAASTCRRLLKAAADSLRPPGPDVEGRQMGDPQYINRLMDWIKRNGTSDTGAALVSTDLEDLGRRLGAANKAGHRGAHAEVSRVEASGAITGTYLLLGDILRQAEKAIDDGDMLTAPFGSRKGGDRMAFLFRLETADGVPAEPATLTSVVPNWRPGDTIPLGHRTLRVVAIRNGDADQPPVLVVE